MKSVVQVEMTVDELRLVVDGLRLIALKEALANQKRCTWADDVADRLEDIHDSHKKMATAT